MKIRFFLFLAVTFLFACSKDDDPDSENLSVSISASGLSDDKLALNNSATFTAILNDYNGDASSLTYRWSLENDFGEFSDGSNALTNPTVSGSTMFCTGKSTGEEKITVSVFDANNNSLGTASYEFTIVSSVDDDISRGCFDQPKIIYTRGSLVYTRNFDGSGEEYLGLGGPHDVAISPDGEWIAQVRWVSDLYCYQMHVMRCDGSTGLIPIEYDSYCVSDGDNQPAFSPDSEKLYFIRAQWGPDIENDNSYKDLAVYDLETGDLQFLTNYYSIDETVKMMDVNPVSGVIAINHNWASEPDSEGNYEIINKLSYLQPETGFVINTVIIGENGMNSLDWHPDGSDIIYSGSIDGFESGLFRINASSGSQPILFFTDQTPNTVGPHSPHYYDGGNRIVFIDQDEGQSAENLWTIDANGNDKQALMEEPSWNLFLHDVLH